MKQSKVPNSSKMPGQDMTKKQPEKLSTRYGLDEFCPFIVDCVERDDSVLILENVLLREHTSTQIAAGPTQIQNPIPIAASEATTPGSKHQKPDKNKL